MPNKGSVARLRGEYRHAADVTDKLADTDKQNRAAHRLHAYYKALRATEECKAAIIGLMSDPSAVLPIAEDGDPLAMVQLSAATYSAGSATVTATRSNHSAQTVSANYSTSDGANPATRRAPLHASPGRSNVRGGRSGHPAECRRGGSPCWRW
jgi:hypothetical protein